MQERINSLRPLRNLLLCTGIVTILMLSLWAMASAQSTPLSGPGYFDFSYQGWTGSGSPTGEKPESKTWWNDGFWWGVLFNSNTSRFHIYRLNWGTQTWEDTGAVVDDRTNTKADVLWDGTKLYIASHEAVQSDGQESGNSNRWARLYRYSYDPALQVYSLDANFPVTINRDVSETLVLAKAPSGHLWITYVSRGDTPGDARDYRVFVNVSSDDGQTWGTPFVPKLNVTDSAVHVLRGDIAAVVAFNNNVGIMWNNSISATNHTLHFAYRAANDTSTSNPWTHQMHAVPGGVDDHISLRSLQATGDGRVFAAIKTSTPLTDPLTQTVPLIGMVARDTDGAFSFHAYSRNSDKDSRPTLLIDVGDKADNSDDKAYIFVAGKEGGSKICYKALEIKSPLASMGNFPGYLTQDCGITFIEDGIYKSINDPTTMKQSATKTTGIVVLASDQTSGTVPANVYVHNVMGNPPPVVTGRSPAQNAAAVPITATVVVSFSKSMNPATITNSSFTVEDGNGAVAGAISYDGGSRTATFTPNAPLNAGATYTVKLTNEIKDSSDLRLNEGIDAGPIIEQWTFTTGTTTVEFAQANYSVNEIDGTATVTVVLSSPSTQVVSVNYATSDNTATAGADYTAANGTVSFAANETVKTFSVPITDDLDPEGPETITLTLSSPVNANLGLLPSATLTIVDNDSLSVQFNPTAFEANEDAGQAVIAVSLSSAVSTPVTVTYATTGIGSTALAGVDYTEVNAQLTFQPGETNKTFAVPLLDDGADEPNETVNLQLTAVDPPTVTISVPGNTAVLTIVDNDSQPLVHFSSASYTVSEAGGSATVTATLSAASAFTVAVNFATSDNTAKAGSDYTATSGTLTFAPGETSKVFTVAISDDAVNEANEVVNLTLSNPTQATLGAPFTAGLTITDNDPAPTVQFGVATISKSEGAGTIEIPVTLSAPSGQLVSVDYATGGGTATADQDYAPTSGTLSFSPGETSAVIELTLLDDSGSEPNETVNVTLSNPQKATLGNPSTVTVTITDNGDTQVTVQFGSTTYSVNEVDGVATINVTLSSAATSVVTVNYATSNGTATAGSDYTATSGMLTFAVGETSKTFAVPIANDGTVETNETVNLTLSNASNAALGTAKQATLTIVDGTDVVVRKLYLPIIAR